MTPQELHNTVTAGEMVTHVVDGVSNSLWLQAGEFVMVKQGGGANARHQLCADETTPARLAAHWAGFCMAPPVRFKHYDNRGFELCSGRPGFPGRKTDDVNQVTCKNCLRSLNRADAPIGDLVRGLKP